MNDEELYDIMSLVKDIKKQNTRHIRNSFPRSPLLSTTRARDYKDVDSFLPNDQVAQRMLPAYRTYDA